MKVRVTERERHRNLPSADSLPRWLLLSVLARPIPGGHSFFQGGRTVGYTCSSFGKAVSLGKIVDSWLLAGLPLLRSPLTQRNCSYFRKRQKDLYNLKPEWCSYFRDLSESLSPSLTPKKWIQGFVWHLKFCFIFFSLTTNTGGMKVTGWAFCTIVNLHPILVCLVRVPTTPASR